MSHIISPKTGRKIQVGGDTYKNLMSDPVYSKKLKTAKKVRKTPLPRAKQQPLSETLKTIPKSQPKKIAKTVKLLGNTSKRSKASHTKGWAASAPQRGKERALLKEKCGNECFLIPSKNKFPVCASLRINQGCSVDCRGVRSAKIRARQWGYYDVARKAEELQRKYKC